MGSSFVHRRFSFVAIAATFAVGLVVGLACRSLTPSSARLDQSKPAREGARASPSAPPAVTTAAESASQRWQRLAANPPTKANEQAMVGLIEALAAVDGEAARTLVAAETNWARRRVGWLAVLRGRASVAPQEALAWAMASRATDNLPELTAVLTGAARHPDAAIGLAQQLVATNPDRARDYGDALIAGLGAAAEFSSAVRFAASGDSANREAWLGRALAQWAAHDPQSATEAWRAVSNEELRRATADGLFLGWAQSDPAALASFALTLPAERERALALSHALNEWLDHDPGAATRWLDRFEPRPEFDSGILTVATLPHLVARSPDVAVGWAEAISSPAVRAGALRNIAQQWAQTDATAARAFGKSQAMSAPDQAAFAEGLAEANQPSFTTNRDVAKSGNAWPE